MYDDVHIYFQYAARAVAGSVPYRDFVVEYPIGAFPLFVLPYLLNHNFVSYAIIFGLEMLLFNAASVLLVAWHVERTEGIENVPASLAWYTAFFATFCPLLITRFDLAPMSVAFAASLLLSSRHSSLGGVAASIGTLMKVFPAAIVIPAVFCEIPWRNARRSHGLAGFAITMVIGGTIWYAVGGHRAISTLEYHLDRGLEIGSLYAGLVMIAGKIAGTPVGFAFRHNSWELVGPTPELIAKFAFPIQALAMVLVAWRSSKTEPRRSAAAAVLVLVAFGKVLSPQYLAWAIPFIACLSGPIGGRSRRHFMVCCVLTTLIYPWSFGRLMAQEWAAVLLLNARNALLIGLFGQLVCWPVDQTVQHID